jgi:hypothetical protein
MFLARAAITGIALLLVSAAGAEPLCTTATMDVYDSPGFACSIDGMLFSNFQYTVTGTAAPLPGDMAVLVMPLVNGFSFQAPFAAPAGTTLDALISYGVSAPDGIAGEGLAMEGFGITGTGAIDIAETVCLGSFFPACPTTASLNVFDNASGFLDNDSVSFIPPELMLGIVKDISVLGGSGFSSGNVSLVDNLTFPPGTPRGTGGGGGVPEPASGVFLWIGLLFFAARGLLRMSRGCAGPAAKNSESRWPIAR